MDNLRIVVAGHVDHGKSTIIGRLLYDAGVLPKQVANRFHRADASRNAPAFAFIMDQLSEEQQGSFTLDTAQAHLRIATREYTLIDTPGHREFLKNMVTGTTRADAAILVTDAAEGPLRQTYLHAYLIAMLGIRQVIVAINKMDLIAYDQHRFEDLSQRLCAHLERIGIVPVAVIPISARRGDNIVRDGDRMPWNRAPTLMDALEDVICQERTDRAMRFLVQCPFTAGGRRTILGRVVSGNLHQGQTLVFGPAGHETAVTSVLLGEGEVPVAGAGCCVGLLLQDPAPVGRGCIGFDRNMAPAITDHFTARVFWINPRPLPTKGRVELLCGTQSRFGCVERINELIDPVSLVVDGKATDLSDSQVGEITFRSDSPMCIDPFEVVPELGRFAIVRDGRIAGGGVVTS